MLPELTVWLTGPSWMMGGGRWPLVFRLSLARAELEPVGETAKHPSQPSSSALTDSVGAGGGQDLKIIILMSRRYTEEITGTYIQ